MNSVTSVVHPVRPSSPWSFVTPGRIDHGGREDTEWFSQRRLGRNGAWGRQSHYDSHRRRPEAVGYGRQSEPSDERRGVPGAEGFEVGGEAGLRPGAGLEPLPGFPDQTLLILESDFAG